MKQTERIVVVGSGASGVHFALTLLRKGYSVRMFDVGREGAALPAPQWNFTALKDRLDDPSGYFLGSRFEGVLLPGSDAEYYGIPPGKDYVFRELPGFNYSTRGFAPLFSFAQGGLAEAWTAGCYPLNAAEVADFPFSYPSLKNQYEEVARRIGITGEPDDLARFMPLHDNLLPPLKLDAHSQKLLEAYALNRDRLNRKVGAYVGRTRVATLSRPLGSRNACDYLGRCLWGCPHEALYTPSQTLRECQSHTQFEYISGLQVDYFKIGSGGRVRSIVTRPVEGGPEQEFPVDRLALAAGTLASSKIVMYSVLRATGERVRLRGLMDNRQILVPFVNLRMLGQRYTADAYQYHLLGMGIQAGDPRDYIHGQITTLKTALLHPIIQNLPFDLQTSTYVTRSLRSALGVVNVNFRDTRRNENSVTLTGGEAGKPLQLQIQYAPSADEPDYIRDGVRKVKQTLKALGCIVPPRMIHMRPMGASVHYAGTMPMTRESGPLTTTEYCQSRDFNNLFVADGSTFPFLPAKNITFTLMANAVRVAEAAF
jgi:choline dehydrogenase-like flavoprotein